MKLLRAASLASRARARRPASSSVAAASRARSAGGAPSSSASSDAAWSRWCARISSSSSPAFSPEPFGEARVILGPRRFRQPGVGDVADEDVLEAISRLARERRSQLGLDEVAQMRSSSASSTDRRSGPVGDRAAPEVSADHRCPLQDCLRVGVRRSTRAAISAWSVSGIRPRVLSSPHSATIRIVSSRKSGLPPVLSSSAGGSSPTAAHRS